jgi:hypothetical protein
MIRTWQKFGLHQIVPEEFDYDEELDLQGTDDGDGIDFLAYNNEVLIHKQNEEEEEADELHTDVDIDEAEVE